MESQKIIQKLKSKEAVIGVVGLGYVGLPLVLRFLEIGHKVIGFDIDIAKIEKLKAGESYIKHISSQNLKKNIDGGHFQPTCDFSKASLTDVIIICVPTPLTKHREPDLSFVTDTMDSLAPFLKKGQIVSLESTTYPGTTEEEIRPRIEKQGFKIGQDIFLVFSPEREDPGNSKFKTQMVPKVVGGSTPACLEVGISLYNAVVDKVVPVKSTQTAEMTKLLENIFRAVNIGLVNELKIVADKMNIDIWEVIDAAATKPFGYVPFYPGPGLGGHCIPIDPFYLTWKAREFDIHTRFIELAGEINTQMPEWVTNKIVEALNTRGKPIKDSKILILGIAYKKNVDDMRESPAVALMELLKKRHAQIFYSDPYFPVFPKMREHSFDLKSVELTKDILAGIDCVVIATDHDSFDYDFVQKNSQLIVDTRGRYRKEFSNVVKS